MKSVKVNGLVVFSGPDTEARTLAASLIRQLAKLAENTVLRDDLLFIADGVIEGNYGMAAGPYTVVSLTNTAADWEVAA